MRPAPALAAALAALAPPEVRAAAPASLPVSIEGAFMYAAQDAGGTSPRATLPLAGLRGIWETTACGGARMSSYACGTDTLVVVHSDWSHAWVADLQMHGAFWVGDQNGPLNGGLKLDVGFMVFSITRGDFLANGGFDVDLGLGLAVRYALGDGGWHTRAYLDASVDYDRFGIGNFGRVRVGARYLHPWRGDHLVVGLRHDSMSPDKRTSVSRDVSTTLLSAGLAW